MRNTFKKIAASVMAVASLVVGVTGISASADYGSRTFGSDATAYLSVSSTSIYGSTSVRTAKKISVTLHATGSGNPVGYSDQDTSVSSQLWGTGYTHATSTHLAGNSLLSSDMSVWNS